MTKAGMVKIEIRPFCLVGLSFVLAFDDWGKLIIFLALVMSQSSTCRGFLSIELLHENNGKEINKQHRSSDGLLYCTRSFNYSTVLISYNRSTYAQNVSQS